MIKNDTLKKKKWLKARTRLNKMRKQHNFVAKTYKGVDSFYLKQNLVCQAEKDAREKQVRGEIAKVMGLNLKDVR